MNIGSIKHRLLLKQKHPFSSMITIPKHLHRRNLVEFLTEHFGNSYIKWWLPLHGTSSKAQSEGTFLVRFSLSSDLIMFRLIMENIE